MNVEEMKCRRTDLKRQLREQSKHSSPPSLSPFVTALSPLRHLSLGPKADGQTVGGVAAPP